MHNYSKQIGVNLVKKSMDFSVDVKNKNVNHITFHTNNLNVIIENRYVNLFCIYV